MAERPIRCVALLSGGIDSQLAIRLMQEQQIEVEALNFKTVFTCCQDLSALTARQLHVPITIVGQDDDYLDLIKEPDFGYGRGANPCVDCRIYMFRKAKTFMEEIGADFIVSGEVVGQRPMSQKRADLDVISYHSELEDLLLRPLSAQRLPPTRPEREGWVDRSRLGAFYGRGRKGIIAWAKQLGIETLPSPSSGCALTEPRFSRKVFDLIQHQRDSDRWQFELLKVGRHFRWDKESKVIIGRNQQDNAQLEFYHGTAARDAALLIPTGFTGPAALLSGHVNESLLRFAVGLVARFSRDLPSDATVSMNRAGRTSQLPVTRVAEADVAVSLTSS